MQIEIFMMLKIQYAVPWIITLSLSMTHAVMPLAHICDMSGSDSSQHTDS
jgi:hypothetical protein